MGTLAQAEPQGRPPAGCGIPQRARRERRVFTAEIGRWCFGWRSRAHGGAGRRNRLCLECGVG